MKDDMEKEIKQAEAKRDLAWFMALLTAIALAADIFAALKTEPNPFNITCFSVIGAALIIGIYHAVDRALGINYAIKRVKFFLRMVNDDEKHSEE